MRSNQLSYPAIICVIFYFDAAKVDTFFDMCKLFLQFFLIFFVMR